MRHLLWLPAVQVVTTLAIVCNACAPQQRPESPPADSQSQPIGFGNLLEFRLAHLEPSGDRIPVEHRGTVLHLDAEPLLSDADFTSVRPYVRDGNLVLRMELDSTAGARLHRTTGDHIGTRMAVVFDSEVVSSAVIQSAVGGHGSLTAAVPTRNPEGAAEQVRNRWPPS